MAAQGTIERIYQKKSPVQHVLDLPDSYVDSIDKCTEERFVLKEDRSGFELRQLESVPALFTIFDEVVVNARDAKVRDASVNKIQIVIDRDNGCISFFNDGCFIPVVVHEDHSVYVAELVHT